MYTIGQVASIIGISRDKLRYYEEKGIVVPTQNNENNYRQYNLNDIDTVLAIEFYRSLDLDFESIKKIHSECDLNGIEEILDKKHRNITNEIERLSKVLKRIHKAKNACKDIEQYLNKYVIKGMPKAKVLDEISDFRAYDEYMVVHDKKKEVEEAPILKTLKRYITFNEDGIVTNKMLITKDIEDDDNENLDGILCYEKCAYTIVKDEPGRDAMSEAFTKSLEWIYENGFTPIGVAIVSMMLLEHTGESTKSYLEVYIPLQ
ncbi:MAG: MerR family transcriptional regulator [Clostridiaceae bacterium]